MNTENLFSKISQKVLELLCQYPNDSFYSNQIAQKVNLSSGGVNQTLRLLAKDGLLKAEKKGKMTFYQVDSSSLIIRQFKIFRTTVQLTPLVTAMRPFAKKIILFGSCAEGMDTHESDIDLFVVSRQKLKMSRTLSKFKMEQKIQLVLKTPQEYVSLEKKEPVFYAEIEKGRILWENQ